MAHKSKQGRQSVAPSCRYALAVAYCTSRSATVRYSSTNHCNQLEGSRKCIRSSVLYRVWARKVNLLRKHQEGDSVVKWYQIGASSITSLWSLVRFEARPSAYMMKNTIPLRELLVTLTSTLTNSCALTAAFFFPNPNGRSLPPVLCTISLGSMYFFSSPSLA